MDGAKYRFFDILSEYRVLKDTEIIAVFDAYKVKGPNAGLQDARAKEVDPNSAPMKCYLDHEECYSLNEITIYWNSPFVFVLAYIFQTIK